MLLLLCRLACRVMRGESRRCVWSAVGPAGDPWERRFSKYVQQRCANPIPSQSLISLRSSRRAGRLPPRRGSLWIAEPRALNSDRRVRSDAAGHPGRGADDRVVAYDRVAAQDRGVGVDDHLVFDGWMPLVPSRHLSCTLIAWKAAPPRYTPDRLHALADLRGLADHDPVPWSMKIRGPMRAPG